MFGWLFQQIRQFVTQPIQETEQARGEYLHSKEGKRFDWRVVIMLTAVGVLLTLRRYYFNSSDWHGLLGWLQETFPDASESLFLKTVAASENRRLCELVYWALGQSLTFVVVPVLLIKLAYRGKLSDYGLKLRGMTDGWYVYLGMYLIMLPIILTVAHSPSFQATYPFYKPATDESLWPRFWIWQVCYAVQFVSLEFFFRGYMVHEGKRTLGVHAVFVMTIPYCMIHFGKPMRETLGAIVAGIVLGFMSLKTRSIWMGAALHIAIAMSMDFAALYATGRL